MLKASSGASTLVSRGRASLAIVAVLGLAGTVVLAPLSNTGPAFADEGFYERINQKFVPAAVETLDIHLEVAPVEQLPPPEPEPEPTPTPAAAPAVAAAPLLYTGGGSPAEWMAAAGIPESDWGYVDYIATRESGWNPNATNASSGACGLIQAHPCSKVPGGGYDPVANLTWANGYANGRYGSWAGAYAFWTTNHWW